MKKYDHYAVAQELIFHLEKEGHANDAANLRAAMEDGSTGTEIFMALRFHLEDMLRKLYLKEDTHLKALRLLSELNDALD